MCIFDHTNLNDPPFEMFLSEFLEIRSDWLLSKLNDDSVATEVGDISSLQLLGETLSNFTGDLSDFPDGDNPGFDASV
jgi:hypothetical protein